jgi:hypothetical protein
MRGRIAPTGFENVTRDPEDRNVCGRCDLRTSVLMPLQWVSGTGDDLLGALVSYWSLRRYTIA